MPASRQPSLTAPAPQGAAFLTTRWSRVMLAGQDEAADSAREALAALCRDYWYPLYAYCRRQGLDMHDAQDATQGFFNHLLEAGTLQRARAEQGRFRTFLLGSLRHFLANERRHQNAAKRGGGALVSFDEMAAEQRFSSEPAARPLRHRDRAQARRQPCCRRPAILHSPAPARTSGGCAALIAASRAATVQSVKIQKTVGTPGNR